MRNVVCSQHLALTVARSCTNSADTRPITQDPTMTHSGKGWARGGTLCADHAHAPAMRVAGALHSCTPCAAHEATTLMSPQPSRDHNDFPPSPQSRTSALVISFSMAGAPMPLPARRSLRAYTTARNDLPIRPLHRRWPCAAYNAHISNSQWCPSTERMHVDMDREHDQMLGRPRAQPPAHAAKSLFLTPQWLRKHCHTAELHLKPEPNAICQMRSPLRRRRGGPGGKVPPSRSAPHMLP